MFARLKCKVTSLNEVYWHSQQQRSFHKSKTSTLLVFNSSIFCKLRIILCIWIPNDIVMKEPHNSKTTGKNIYKHTLLHLNRDWLTDVKKKQKKQAIYNKHKMSTLRSFPKGKYAVSCVKWKQARMFVIHTLINIFPGSDVICTRPRNSDMS